MHAVAGTHAVFFGFDLTDEARDGCLGIALHREDLTDGTSRWLSGFKTFKSQIPAPALTAVYQTEAQPIQGMWWGDYTAKPARSYRYTIVPRYGVPGELTSRDAVTASVDLATDDPSTGVHGVYFNRGVAASQAYAARFGAPPDQLPPDVRAEAMRWLSRGLHEALIAFITDGASASLAIRAAVYELTEPTVLAAFAQAHAAGADVRIVYHAKGDQGQLNEAAIEAAGLDRSMLIPRTRAVIAHNKFIIRADRDGADLLRPAQLWTGSTNPHPGRHLRPLQRRPRGSRRRGGAALSRVLDRARRRPCASRAEGVDGHPQRLRPRGAGPHGRPLAVQPAHRDRSAGLVRRRLRGVAVEHPHHLAVRVGRRSLRGAAG